MERKATKRHSEESRQGPERFFAIARGERLRRPVEWYRCFMASKEGAIRQRCAGLDEWRLPAASRIRILKSYHVGVGLIDCAPVLGSWCGLPTMNATNPASFDLTSPQRACGNPAPTRKLGRQIRLRRNRDEVAGLFNKGFKTYAAGASAELKAAAPPAA